MSKELDNLANRVGSEEKQDQGPKDYVEESNTEGVKSQAEGSATSVVVQQIERLGKAGLLIFVTMFAAMVAVAIIAGYSMGSGEESRATTRERLDDMNAGVRVLEYDVKTICAQLIAREIITTCH